MRIIRQELLSIYKKLVKTVGGRNLSRFYPIRIANNLAISLLKSNYSNIQGSKMFLDSLFRDISISGVWEPLQTEIVKKEIKKGDNVLDIGANIGYYTLLFAKLVGTEGKVFSFEPDPTNFALLKKNVEINSYKNVIIVKKACSDQNGKVKLYLSTKNTGDHRMYDSGDNRKFIEVESIRLDDYFRSGERKIDFVKMDVQGAEAKTIDGMSILLQKNNNLKIISEFWPYGLEKCGTKAEYYPLILLKHGFKAYKINEREKKIEEIKIEKLLQKYPPKLENSINLLWSKKITF